MQDSQRSQVKQKSSSISHNSISRSRPKEMSSINLKKIDSRTSNQTSTEDECSSCLVENLNGVVLQYLENRGLEESYNTFYRECKIKGIPLPQELPEPSFLETIFKPSDGEQLLNYFDEEEGVEMLEMWTQFLEDMEPLERETIKTITFYLQIYVAIIPYRQNKSIEEKMNGMIGLREFFQQKSNEFTTDENMLSLFALPFVADPMSHSIFKNIFQNPWRDKLRSQVTNVIRHHFQNRNINLNSSCELTDMFVRWMGQVSESDSDDDNLLPPPSLSKCFLNKSNQTDENIQVFDKVKSDVLKKYELETKAQFKKQNNDIEHYKKRIVISEDRYYKLLRVTAEVVGSLEQAVQGKAQDIEDLIHRLQLVFPELFPSELLISKELEKRKTNLATENNNSSQEPSIPEISLEEKYEQEKELKIQRQIQSNKDTEEIHSHRAVSEIQESKQFVCQNRGLGRGRDVFDNDLEINETKRKIKNPSDISEHRKFNVEKEGTKETCHQHDNYVLPTKEEIHCSPRNKIIPQFKTPCKSLLEILTGSSNANDQIIRKTDLSTERTKRTRSPHTHSHIQENIDKQVDVDSKKNSSQISNQGNIFLPPRKFLQTQPQFAARSEDHPLNNYQQATPFDEASTQLWQNNQAPVIIDPRPKAELITEARNSSNKSTPRNIEKTNLSINSPKSTTKAQGQYQGTLKSAFTSKIVSQLKGGSNQPRKTWIESIPVIEHTIDLQAPAPAPSVRVPRQRRSKLNANNSYTVASTELPPTNSKQPPRQNDPKTKSNQKVLKQNTSNASYSHGAKPYQSDIINSDHVANGANSHNEEVDADGMIKLDYFHPADFERRYQWFSRSESDIKMEGIEVKDYSVAFSPKPRLHRSP